MPTVNLDRQEDRNFYSSLKDENYPMKYEEELRLKERALTSMTSREGKIERLVLAKGREINYLSRQNQYMTTRV